MKNRFFIRLVVCFVLVLSMFLVCITRILYINTYNSYKVAANNNTVRVDISTLRGNIFDRNGTPITGTSSQSVTVFSPTPSAVMYVSSALSYSQRTAALENLNKGKPAVVKTDGNVLLSGATNITYTLHNNNDLLCKHLIGYTDSSYHGVSGLEKIYDSLLYSSEKIGVRYALNGDGTVLSGIEGEVFGKTDILNSGVVTTIDTNIQRVSEKAMENIETGALLVSEVKTGKILAMVSRPDFDINNIAEALNDEDSPLINRCLSSYNVGSAFKLCVAAAALENNKCGGFSYNCTGNTVINGNTFNCHNLSGHGQLALGDAIAYSCNTFFYRFAAQIGATDVYDMARVFGFGQKKKLAESLYTENENLTDLKKLVNDECALANLSIGQGQLLASPVTMLNLYNAIASGGVYYQPSVIEGIMENGVIKRNEQNSLPTKALSQETASILKEYLIDAVEYGTGTKAKNESVRVAGKTATAQTGWIKNGKSVEHSWFCGFFPADNPVYSVVVLIENTDSSTLSGAEVFSLVARSVNGLIY